MGSGEVNRYAYREPLVNACTVPDRSAGKGEALAVIPGMWQSEGDKVAHMHAPEIDRPEAAGKIDRFLVVQVFFNVEFGRSDGVDNQEIEVFKKGKGSLRDPGICVGRESYPGILVSHQEAAGLCWRMINREQSEFNISYREG